MLVDHGERETDELSRLVTVWFRYTRLRRQAVAWPHLTQEAHPERHDFSVTDQVRDKVTSRRHREHAVREHRRVPAYAPGVFLVDMLGGAIAGDTGVLHDLSS
jgi:hypothetical protein